MLSERKFETAKTGEANENSRINLLERLRREFRQIEDLSSRVKAASDGPSREQLIRETVNKITIDNSILEQVLIPAVNDDLFDASDSEMLRVHLDEARRQINSLGTDDIGVVEQFNCLIEHEKKLMQLKEDKVFSKIKELDLDFVYLDRMVDDIQAQFSENKENPANPAGFIPSNSVHSDPDADLRPSKTRKAASYFLSL